MKSRFALLSPVLPSLVLLLASALPLGATEWLVGGPSELNRALSKAAPGDVILLKDGEWRDLHLELSRGGSARAPLELRAEHPGQAWMTGDSTLALAAPYVVVSGLHFIHGVCNAEAVITFHSDHGLVREVTVEDYLPAQASASSYWVLFSGSDNRLEQSSFRGKSNLGPVVGNGAVACRHNSVSHCLFADIPYAPGNGREILRIWGAGKVVEADDDGAFFLIESNLFLHADGEGAEIISLKSNHNRVINNTVIASRGCINIRRGNFNTIEGNVILGEAQPHACGLRMSGEHTLIRHNLVSGCEYGIELSSGDYIDSALTPGFKPDIKRDPATKRHLPVPLYPQNKDVVVEGNVLASNQGPDLDLGAGYKKRWPAAQLVLVPVSCVLRDNRFLRPAGGVSVAGTEPEAAPPLDRLHFSPNRWEGNQVYGGTVSYAPARAGCSCLPMPAAWSLKSELEAFHPLTPNEVGPSWERSSKPASE